MTHVVGITNQISDEAHTLQAFRAGLKYQSAGTLKPQAIGIVMDIWKLHTDSFEYTCPERLPHSDETV